MEQKLEIEGMKHAVSSLTAQRADRAKILTVLVSGMLAAVASIGVAIINYFKVK